MIIKRRKESRSIRNITPANFVYFRYRDSDGVFSNRNVLTMTYDEENELLHALDLKKFTENNILETSREIAQESQDSSEFEEMFDEENRILLPDVLDDEMEHWYNTEYSSSRYEENPYRTFREDRISNLRRIEVTII